MAKLKRECQVCHKMKTIEYRGPCTDDFFCSKECATKDIINLSMFKCKHCGKELSSQSGIFTTNTQIWIANEFHKMPELFCSIDCIMKNGGILTAEEFDNRRTSHEREVD